MSKSLTGNITRAAVLNGQLSVGGMNGLSASDIEAIVIDTLISFGIVPVILDGDDSILVDSDNSILLNA